MSLNIVALTHNGLPRAKGGHLIGYASGDLFIEPGRPSNIKWPQGIPLSRLTSPVRARPRPATSPKPAASPSFSQLPMTNHPDHCPVCARWHGLAREYLPTSQGRVEVLRCRHCGNLSRQIHPLKLCDLYDF